MVWNSGWHQCMRNQKSTTIKHKSVDIDIIEYTFKVVQFNWQ